MNPLEADHELELIAGMVFVVNLTHAAEHSTLIWYPVRFEPQVTLPKFLQGICGTQGL